MNLFLSVIFLFYIVGIILNPHKTFLFYVLINPLINNNFAIFSQPGLPLLSLNMAICIYTLFYYLTFKKKEIRNLKTFPLIIPFYFYLSSLFLSTVFSTIPILQSLTRALADFNNQWLFILLLWMIITSKKDLILIIKFYFFLFFIMSLYGVLEKSLGYNPIMEFESSWIIDMNKTTTWFYGFNNRLGMGRIQSFTTHPITYGAMLAIIIVSNIYLLISNRYKKQNIFFIISFLILMIINLIFTNSRSPILFLLVAALGLFSFRKKIFAKFIIPFIIIFSLFFYFFSGYVSSYYQNFESLMNINNSNTVGGSDLFMRLEQFQLTFELFKQRIFFGLGIGSFNPTAEVYTGLLGGESVWIQTLLERGIWGGISYLVLLVFLYKKFRLKNNASSNQFFFFIISAFIIFATVTGEMETRVLFLTVILIIYQLFRPIVSLGRSNINILPKTADSTDSK